MLFVNRIEEIKRLIRLTQKKSSSLGVVWGRRRVGKTRLLLEWTRKTGGLYFVADQSSAASQRQFMALTLEEVLPGFSKVHYPDWQSLFARVGEDAVAKSWRGPWVIDEVPYLFESSPELPSILQKFVDHDMKKSGLVLVLSGSSQRMMLGSILEQSAPLYGRADEIIKLGPIQPRYLAELGLKDPKKIIEFYSVFGGTPKYWELALNISEDLIFQIDQLILDPLGALHEEPDRLLREESPYAMHLRPILEMIGFGANKLSEISSRLGIQTTSLSRSMKQLIQLELISREIPYGCDSNTSKKTLYKMRDPFLKFWFQVVAPRRSLLAHVSQEMRLKWIREQMPFIVSSIWETLCRQALPRISETWDCLYEPAGRYWHGKGPEWDLVSLSKESSKILVGEAKWLEKTPSTQWVYEQFDKLKSKGIPPIERPRNIELEYALFIPDMPVDYKPREASERIITARDVIFSPDFKTLSSLL